jgi:signal transduction histidine kinase
MNIIFLGSILVSGILNLIMGIVIIFGSKEKRKSLPFALFSFATFLVALSYYFIHNSEFPVSVRISYSLGALVPTFLLAWIHQYASKHPQRWKDILIYAAGGIFFLLPFMDDLVVSSIHKDATLGFIEDKGILFPLYAGFFIAAYGIVLFKLIRLSLATGIENRKRNRIILTGFFLYGGLGIIFGLILPYFGYEQFTDLDVPSTIIFVGFTSYAIVHYRWMSIKVIAVEILAALVSGMALLEVFLVETPEQRIYKSVAFVIVAVLSTFMVRSVINEVNRKEELQRLSNKLALANDRLRKLDTAKTDFLSMASHQMRTPITTAKGYLSLLMDGDFGVVSDKQLDTLKRLYANNDRMSQLIEDLLNVSRIESGRLEFNFEERHIEDLCREVVDSLTMKAKDRNLYLNYVTPRTPLPELMIDGPKVREVISNIVDNAVKYTPSGGVTVKVEVRPKDKGDRSDYVRVSVTDTGIGIPETELPYLFAKFSRGKDLSRLNTGGTGLGLYVAKNMIENNGGKIWVESAGEGKGSQFIVELPVEQTEKRAKSIWGGSG